jgi:hypothetical protein
VSAPWAASTESASTESTPPMRFGGGRVVHADPAQELREGAHARGGDGSVQGGVRVLA